MTEYVNCCLTFTRNGNDDAVDAVIDKITENGPNRRNISIESLLPSPADYQNLPFILFPDRALDAYILLDVIDNYPSALLRPNMLIDKRFHLPPYARMVLDTYLKATGSDKVAMIERARRDADEFAQNENDSLAAVGRLMVEYWNRYGACTLSQWRETHWHIREAVIAANYASTPNMSDSFYFEVANTTPDPFIEALADLCESKGVAFEFSAIEWNFEFADLWRFNGKGELSHIGFQDEERTARLISAIDDRTFARNNDGKIFEHDLFVDEFDNYEDGEAVWEKMDSIDCGGLDPFDYFASEVETKIF